MTPIDSRTAAANDIEPNIAAINQALDHMQRIYTDRAMRHENAAQAGTTLAYDVARFLDDPEGVGTDALREAYSLFMGRHAGGFSDTTMS